MSSNILCVGMQAQTPVTLRSKPITKVHAFSVLLNVFTPLLARIDAVESSNFAVVLANIGTFIEESEASHASQYSFGNLTQPDE